MKSHLSRSLRTIVFAMAMASAPIAALAMGDEEFVGPFASWANVKTGYGAVGDGVTDDTAAIQKALNALGSAKPTLYFPAGTYRITQTLTLAGQGYVNVIGQDPADTSIVWAGAAGGTMLYLNGIMCSRFNRLTFNGQGTAGVAVDQSWVGTGNYFDTGNEYADDVFENAGTGFRCGNLGYGCAETSMLRDHFIGDNVAGVAMKNFNALDMFIWYSLFQNDDYGVTNNPGAGNFHVYNSIFENSTAADIVIGNTGVFNFRNNYSIGSSLFLGAWNTNNPANITVEGNTILDTTGALLGDNRSIYVGDLGPLLLIDNTIRSRPGGSGTVVGDGAWNASDVFSMGNTFTVSPTVTNTSGGHTHQIQDQVVARSTVNPSPPTLPVTPPNNNRQIFEVAPGSTTAQLQQVINQAAAASGDKPVVHIQPGTYHVNATLVVPAGRDMQIIGDGNYSQLVWSGSGAGPVMRLQGPSKATLRDFSVNGNNNSGNGIEVDDADQPGSSVFMEQSTLFWCDTKLFVDSLDNTNVQLHGFYHSYDSSGTGTSVDVIGGGAAAQGDWLGGVTNIFAGASSGNYINYAVSNGAHLSVRDVWYDAGGGNGFQIANVSGTGAFAYAGSTAFLPNALLPVVSFNSFRGPAALVNVSMQESDDSNIQITGNGTGGQILGLGLVGTTNKFFNDATSPLDISEFLNGQTTYNAPSGAASTELPEVGSASPAFLAATLSQLRTQQPTLLAPLPSGVTDVRFYRMFVSSANIGIHLEGASATSPAPLVNGACGSSNGAQLTGAPTTGLCSTGTASAVSGSGPWNWSCAGSNGGTTASCSAQLQINGSCGPIVMYSLLRAPVTGLCSTGTASAVSGTGPWNWSCASTNGGKTVQCSVALRQ